MMRIFELNVSQVNIFIVEMFIIQFINHTLAINIRHFQFFIAKLTVNLLIYQTTLKNFHFFTIEKSHLTRFLSGYFLLDAFFGCFLLFIAFLQCHDEQPFD